jgi:hypothetical protein
MRNVKNLRIARVYVPIATPNHIVPRLLECLLCAAPDAGIEQ